MRTIKEEDEATPVTKGDRKTIAMCGPDGDDIGNQVMKSCHYDDVNIPPCLQEIRECGSDRLRGFHFEIIIADAFPVGESITERFV